MIGLDVLDPKGGLKARPQLLPQLEDCTSGFCPDLLPPLFLVSHVPLSQEVMSLGVIMSETWGPDTLSLEGHAKPAVSSLGPRDSMDPVFLNQVLNEV